MVRNAVLSMLAALVAGEQVPLFPFMAPQTMKIKHELQEGASWPKYQHYCYDFIYASVGKGKDEDVQRLPQVVAPLCRWSKDTCAELSKSLQAAVQQKKQNLPGKRPYAAWCEDLYNHQHPGGATHTTTAMPKHGGRSNLFKIRRGKASPQLAKKGHVSTTAHPAKRILKHAEKAPGSLSKTTTAATTWQQHTEAPGSLPKKTTTTATAATTTSATTTTVATSSPATTTTPFDIKAQTARMLKDKIYASQRRLKAMKAKPFAAAKAKKAAAALKAASSTPAKMAMEVSPSKANTKDNLLKKEIKAAASDVGHFGDHIVADLAGRSIAKAAEVSAKSTEEVQKADLAFDHALGAVNKLQTTEHEHSHRHHRFHA